MPKVIQFTMCGGADVAGWLLNHVFAPRFEAIDVTHLEALPSVGRILVVSEASTANPFQGFTHGGGAQFRARLHLDVANLLDDDSPQWNSYGKALASAEKSADAQPLHH